MKVTNAAKLPQPLVDAVTNDPYTRGESDISCTQLIDSPRIRVLSKKHYDQIEEDAIDRIWSLLGQSIHTILERADSSGIVEQRLYMDVLGWKLSGQFDRLVKLPDGCLQDYKVTSTYSVIYGKQSWEDQLNVLAHLARANGQEIKKLQIVAILRDWQKSKIFQEGYPKQQVATINIPLWEPKIAQKYIENRVFMHQEAEVHLPLCSDEDRWHTPDKWAVMKKGRKSALRVLDSEEDACNWAARNGHGDGKCTLFTGISIVHRPGADRRCEDYCSVCQFCDQYNTR